MTPSHRSPAVQTVGNTVVVMVNLTAAEGEIPRQVVLVERRAAELHVGSDAIDQRGVSALGEQAASESVDGGGEVLAERRDERGESSADDVGSSPSERKRLPTRARGRDRRAPAAYTIASPPMECPTSATSSATTSSTTATTSSPKAGGFQSSPSPVPTRRGHRGRARRPGAARRGRRSGRPSSCGCRPNRGPGRP